MPENLGTKVQDTKLKPEILDVQGQDKKSVPSSETVNMPFSLTVWSI
jgi:hypothetical protein